MRIPLSLPKKDWKKLYPFLRRSCSEENLEGCGGLKNEVSYCIMKSSSANTYQDSSNPIFWYLPEGI